ncbi:helix-turn-helix domain-containing protein [Limibacter armeniacum]|uniref:helix-turn-helix domain-containing protein n=1 Tax=Limibacter armeniacum TaxID=466084 RepID=UPI002FE56BAD
MKHLTIQQRKQIASGISKNKSDAAIAREIGVHRSTVGREIKRCGGREFYKAMLAEKMAIHNQFFATEMFRCPEGKGSQFGKTWGVLDVFVHTGDASYDFTRLNLFLGSTDKNYNNLKENYFSFSYYRKQRFILFHPIRVSRDHSDSTSYSYQSVTFTVTPSNQILTENIMVATSSQHNANGDTEIFHKRIDMPIVAFCGKVRKVNLKNCYKRLVA